jgi:hypothetical protein
MIALLAIALGTERIWFGTSLVRPRFSQIRETVSLPTPVHRPHVPIRVGGV